MGLIGTSQLTRICRGLMYSQLYGLTVDSHLHRTPSHFRTPVYFHLSRWSGLCLVLSVTYGDRHPPYTPLLVRFVIYPFLSFLPSFYRFVLRRTLAGSTPPSPANWQRLRRSSSADIPCFLTGLLRTSPPSAHLYLSMATFPRRTRDDIGLLVFETRSHTLFTLLLNLLGT